MLNKVNQLLALVSYLPYKHESGFIFSHLILVNKVSKCNETASLALSSNALLI